MPTLVHAVLTMRRTVRAAYGFVAAMVFGALTLLGAFDVSPDRLGLEHGLVAAAWLAVLGLRAAVRFQEEDAPETRVAYRAVLDLELGLLLLVGVHAAVQVAGGLTADLYPLVYVLVAFVAAFAHKPAGSLLVLAAVGYESAIHFAAERQTDPDTLAMHSVFIVFFGVLNLLFTRAEIARVRERSRRQLDDEKEKVRTETRMFRLVAAPSPDAASDEERLFRSSVEEVHHALYHVLHLLHRSLDLHTAVVLLIDEAEERLRIVELVTDSEHIAEGPFLVGEGAVGAVAKRGHAMRLEHMKLGYKGLSYYRGPALVRAFLGVPLLENGRPVGALCVDRIEDRPFTSKEEEVLEGTVRQVQRALQNERVFVQLERSKREQTVLYRASQQLGAALNEDAVIEAGLAAAADIASYDFAAISLYSPDTRRHTIRRAVGDGADRFTNFSFRDNASLTAMAVKNRHYLPYRGEYDPKQQTVYTRRANLRDMRSLLILPLVVREDAIGTLALAAHRRDAFPDSVRPTLQVLANQLAVSMANAASVRRLEEMATTDGLTGCLNKRAFLSELDQKLRSAHRFNRELSLIVTDIDHFKSVNDTYGHATGDTVIKELGHLLRGIKRETDVVARFGGEEFCVLCEETGAEGAKQLAERVREALAAREFQTEIGRLSVTCSLGVATFPMDADDTGELFERADQALYAAKRGGRNRVCVAS